MFNSIYSSEHFSPAEDIVSWYHVLINSTMSTTRYLTDNYANVEFRVIGQEEKDNRIYRISEFVMAEKVIVHSVVEMDIATNPPEFIELIRGRLIPIGDILRDHGYQVERRIVRHDASSKEYEMVGDVNIKITEKYYNM